MKKLDDNRSFFASRDNIGHPYIRPHQHHGLEAWSGRPKMMRNMRFCACFEEAYPQG
jgi:hypothetical protein